MTQSTTKTCATMDIFMYIARVITFDFAPNGISLSISRANQIITRS
ncbi:hypothetical protein FHR92_000457 [Fontibacillus solani]|uniref:Uncharacterized protein n=1 Tax=Fontibacillus solani TaxID=1572857 RepID=A0A7W3XQ04_9BACL|nr:RAxF-45 family protein [Fontibacillus solani]MBA9084003.1 hypothetical protein [Fontibacillus solani]